MLSRAPLFLAFRYLRPKRSFVSIITVISVMGVMLGVGVLMVVISVMKGFEVDFKKLVIGFEPHIILSQDEPPMLPPGVEAPEASRTNWREIVKRVKENPEVTSAAPFAAGIAFVEKEGSAPQAVECFALPDRGAEPLVEKLSEHLHRDGGEFDLGGDTIILADRTADTIGAFVGDVVTIYSSNNLKELVSRMRAADELEDDKAKATAYEEIKELILPLDVEVAGIMRSETAGGRAYLPLHVGQELFGLGDRVSGIGVEVADAFVANEVADALEQNSLGVDWFARTWMDMHRAKLAAVQNERTMMYFVLSFIVLVAAFSVMNTTITVTVQKRREIGILTALGSRVEQIVGIFVSQAAVVAVLGTILGLIGGSLVLAFRNQIREGLANLTGRDIFPADIYFLAEIPAHTETSDVVSICAVSIVLCLIAALLPAWFAARVDPAVALRDS